MKKEFLTDILTHFSECIPHQIADRTKTALVPFHIVGKKHISDSTNDIHGSLNVRASIVNL